MKNQNQKLKFNLIKKILERENGKEREISQNGVTNWSKIDLLIRSGLIRQQNRLRLNLISNIHYLFNVYIKLSDEENRTKCNKKYEKIVELIEWKIWLWLLYSMLYRFRMNKKMTQIFIFINVRDIGIYWGQNGVYYSYDEEMIGE